MTPQQLAELALSGVWRQGRGQTIAEYTILYPWTHCRIMQGHPHYPPGSVLLACEARVPDASERYTSCGSVVYASFAEAVAAAMDWLHNEAAPLMLTALPERVRFRAGHGWRIGRVEPSLGPDHIKIAAEDTGALILLPVSDVVPLREHVFAC